MPAQTDILAGKRCCQSPVDVAAPDADAHPPEPGSSCRQADTTTNNYYITSFAISTHFLSVPSVVGQMLRTVVSYMPFCS